MRSIFSFCLALVAAVSFLSVVTARSSVLSELKDDIKDQKIANLKLDETASPSEIANITIPPNFCSRCGSTCEGYFSGSIASPNFPSNYSNNMDCLILARVPLGYRVQLFFTDFITESGLDYVKLYDGRSTSDPLLASLSGTPALPLPYFKATTNEILVRFWTDLSQTYSGWKADYSIY